MEEKKKKGIFFSKGMKSLVIAVYILAIGMFSTAAFVVFGLLDNGFAWEDLGEKPELSYDETNECGMHSAGFVEEVSVIAENESAFFKNGKLDMEKKVDITDLTSSKKTKNKNTTYTVKDIKDLYESGALDSLSSEVYTVQNDYFDDDEITIEMAGDQTDQGYEYSREFLYLYEYGKSEESILPESGISLADYAKSNPKDVSLMELYQALIDAGDRLNRCILTASELNQGTNLMYAVENMDTNVVYTNVEAWQDGYNEKTSGSGVKILFDALREDGAFTSGTLDNENAAQSVIKNYFENNYISGENERITILLNTQYPVKDSFYYSSSYYEKYAKWSNIMLAALLFAFLLGVIAFILAGIQTGRTSRNTELQLSSMDRIPTEVTLGGGIIALFLMISVTAVYMGEGGGINILMGAVIGAVAEVLLGGIFLLVSLSLIRKMKGHILWSSSFTHTIVRSCKTVYMARKTSGRMIMGFVLLVMGNMLAIGIFHSVGFLLAMIGDGLVLLYLIRENAGRQVIRDGLGRIANGELDFKINAKDLIGDNQEMAEAVNHVGDGLQKAVKETVKSERLKADLITNVSHDIKTPLTSIINYVDLLKREDIQDPRVKGYIEILDSKSQRLKQLTEDLVEASKISSGNVVLDMQPIHFNELIRQTNGEFEEKFEARGLSLVCTVPDEPMIILADGRRMWRVVENLYNNVAKYAMENTRVYVEVKKIGCRIIFEIKNVSENPLNMRPEELTERFIRGDVSRNTEGSGLGLSIAQNLVKMQKGTFDIYLDGDLFKVMITFDAADSEMNTAAGSMN